MSTFYLCPGQVRHYENRPFKYLGVQYTKQGATRSKFLELGFTEVTLQARPDDRYYFVSGPDNTGAYSAIERPLEDLKASATAQLKEQANAILSRTDWQVIRGVEDPGKPVNPTLRQYRRDVRSAADAQEALVQACSTVEELAGLPSPVWPEEPA